MSSHQKESFFRIWKNEVNLKICTFTSEAYFEIQYNSLELEQSPQLFSIHSQ